MGDALMGAMTDIMHDVRMCCTGDAQMGAMTAKMHNVQMEGMYDVWTDGMDDTWTGAMTDIVYDGWTGGDITRISCR